MGKNIVGTVVGYGSLEWPPTEHLNGDTGPVVVYLIQVADGSSSLGSACAVVRADRIFEVE